MYIRWLSSTQITTSFPKNIFDRLSKAFSNLLCLKKYLVGRCLISICLRRFQKSFLRRSMHLPAFDVAARQKVHLRAFQTPCWDKDILPCDICALRVYHNIFLQLGNRQRQLGYHITSGQAHTYRCQKQISFRKLHYSGQQAGKQLHSSYIILC